MKQRRIEIGEVVNTAQSNIPSNYREGIINWFADLWPTCEISGLSNISFPEEGRSSEIVLFDLSWREAGIDYVKRFVLRIEPGDELLAPKLTDNYSSSVDLEYRVQLSVARHSKCPMAPLIGFESKDQYFGRPFYVMEYVQGRVVPTVGSMINGFLANEATPEQREYLVYTALDKLVEIHSIDWHKAELQWLNPNGDQNFTVLEQLDLYRRAAEKALSGVEHPVFFSICEWLGKNAPQQTNPGLCWGDARIGNMLVNEDYDVVAVLDWEFSSVGNTEVDLGWWLYCDHTAHELEGQRRLPGYPTRSQQISYYEKEAGYSIGDELYWVLFQAMKSIYAFIKLQNRMHRAEVIPKDDYRLMYDNFAIDFIEKHMPAH